HQGSFDLGSKAGRKGSQFRSPLIMFMNSSSFAICIAQAAGLVLGSFPDNAFGGPLDTWTTPSSVPVTNHLQSITFANGLFVAVGETGAILTSPDGTDWVMRQQTPNTFISSVTYGNGEFVAGSADWSSTVLTSTDGSIGGHHRESFMISGF